MPQKPQPTVREKLYIGKRPNLFTEENMALWEPKEKPKRRVKRAPCTVADVLNALDKCGMIIERPEDAPQKPYIGEQMMEELNYRISAGIIDVDKIGVIVEEEECQPISHTKPSYLSVLKSWKCSMMDGLRVSLKALKQKWLP